MGQHHSHLSKSTVSGENVRIKYAASCMKGSRPCMEDAHAAFLDVDGARITSFFVVYDGHGGPDVARYCAGKSHTELPKDEEYHTNLDNAVRRVFSRVDQQLRETDGRAVANPPHFRFNFLSCLRSTAPCIKGTPYSEGSTACVALIRETQIIVGNVGDSRCVLSRDGQAMDLSTDHKPNLPDECLRIQNAGGEVTMYKGCHHVDRNLAMSRSMGDFQFKSNPDLPDIEQKVTCNPDVYTMGITHDTDFLLIASDGIWDVLSSQDAVTFVKQNLDNGTTNLGAICENLLTCCVKSKDNATVILVQFKHAGRLPHPPPASPVMPVVHQADAAGNSSVADPEASAEAKADSDSEIKEAAAEDALLPLSTMPTEL